MGLRKVQLNIEFSWFDTIIKNFHVFGVFIFVPPFTAGKKNQNSCSVKFVCRQMNH